MGEPQIELKIDPLFGQKQYKILNFPSAQEIIRELIYKEIKKMTYPNRHLIIIYSIKPCLSQGHHRLSDDQKVTAEESGQQQQLRGPVASLQELQQEFNRLKKRLKSKKNAEIMKILLLNK